MRPDLDRYLLAFGAARDRVIPPPPPKKGPRFVVEGRYSYALVEAADAESAAHEYALAHGISENEFDTIKVSPLGEAITFDVDVAVDVRRRG